jgi:two-component system, cell cycle response regulator CtrA
LTESEANRVVPIPAIVRPSEDHPEPTIRTGRLAVNLDTRVVSVDDQPVHLTGREYAILELLSLRKGITLTKEMFLNHLYRGVDEPELKIIDVFVCTLRRKARPGDRRQSLHRNGVGPRLYASRPSTNGGHPDTPAMMPEGSVSDGPHR